eukprot:7600899-Pyramimonas_sp.AAC.1
MYSCQRACDARKVHYYAPVAAALKDWKAADDIPPRRLCQMMGRDGRKFARTAMDFKPLARC